MSDEVLCSSDAALNYMPWLALMSASDTRLRVLRRRIAIGIVMCEQRRWGERGRGGGYRRRVAGQFVTDSAGSGHSGHQGGPNMAPCGKGLIWRRSEVLLLELLRSVCAVIRVAT
jgi:hypothetical protein